MEANNMAAMREALVMFVHDFASFRKDVENGTLHMMQCMDFVKEFIPLMESAISAPPRQCDVGTPEEQDDRWESFCASHHSPWKITGGTGTMICDCPCYKGNNKCNRFAWAQMPYEAEQKGENDGR